MTFSDYLQRVILMNRMKTTNNITAPASHCVLPRRIFLILIISSLLCACNQQENELQDQQGDRQSSSLADTPQAPGVRFANFKNSTLTIDPTLFPADGERLFLKLSRQNAEILYIGRVQQYMPISIKVDHLLDEEQLRYELFTEKNTVFGIITL